MALVFDIETDGLLEELTKIHSLCIKNSETGQTWSCADQPGHPSIQRGLEILQTPDTIVGHNIVGFDLLAIQKLFPEWKPKGLVRDTMILAQIIWPNILDYSVRLRRKYGPDILPGQLIKSHSLEAWGYRLRCHKGKFGKTTDWQFWTPEMQSYCEQDVNVTEKLWNLVLTKNYPERPIEIEHEFARIMRLQELAGVNFDRRKAEELYARLSKRRAELLVELQELFQPWWMPVDGHWSEDRKVRWKDISKKKATKGQVVATYEFNAHAGDAKFTIPKVGNKTKGIVKGCPFTKVKLVEFNPNSGDHIANRFQTLYGWQPVVKTETGLPKVDEEILSELEYPGVKDLLEYMVVAKRISQLAEGNTAWLKHEHNGQIHGRILCTSGTATFRCAHVTPNLGQVPAVGKPYGKECRELFYASPGWVMVGCDASGLEARCLSHYTCPYDGGSFRDVVLSGDIHEENMRVTGIKERPIVKRFFYGYMYGAGNPLLGFYVAPDAPKSKHAAIGKRIRSKFEKGIPGLGRLQDSLKAVLYERKKKFGVKFLTGIAGHKVYVRSDHSALNFLLQHCGAVVMKVATKNLWDSVEAKYMWGRDWMIVLHVHDEWQMYVRPEIAEEVGKMAVNAIKKAGEDLKMNCPLDGEYKIGQNWAETH
jgi:hypothetical protein